MRLPFTYRPLLALCGAMALAATAGCGSAPRTAVPGAANTGTFPNLNVPPTPAAEPISPQEKAAMFGSISAARSGQARAAGPATPTANPILLKKIAAGHADETLREIEAQ